MMAKVRIIHEQIERWFRESLDIVEPRSAVRHALGWDERTLSVDGIEIPIEQDSRLLVIAIGKAAPAMAKGVVDVLGARIDRGIVLTKDGHLDGEIGGFKQFEAAHPIPDQRSLDATSEILQAVKGLSSQDIVLALISGGGSALLELPKEPITLEQFQTTTRLLLHAGAGIHDLNSVRSALSEVKAGELRRSIGDARCVSLLLSDVLGNDPAVIASGPTIRQSASAAKAIGTLERFQLVDQVPTDVYELLSSSETALEVGRDDDVWQVIADNETLVSELKNRIARDGFNVQIRWPGYDGDAIRLGRRLVDDVASASKDADVLLGGGEATVEVTGDGIGGRNTEAALASALALQSTGGWCIASLASDGDDGIANAAGAIADPGSITRGFESRLDGREMLAANDSASFFRQTDGLVVTGPTGTNVNDVYIAVRISDRSMEG